MSKIFRKLTAVAMAGVMAVSMAVTANAENCVPHVTTYNEVGLTHDVYAGSHTYIAEYRTNPDGTITEITATCSTRSIGIKYEYRCVKCGTVTASGTSTKLTHSSCEKKR